MDSRNSAGVRKSYRINLATAREGKLYTVKGRFIRVADASDTTAVINIAIGENTPSSYEALKKNGSLVEGNGFDRIYITNTAQADKWVRIIVSEGSSDYDVDNPSLGAIDSIGSIDGVVQVELANVDVATGTKDKLRVYDDQNLAIKDMMNGTDLDLKRGALDLTNASYAASTGSSLTVVTSGANTNGVLIRYGQVMSYGSGAGEIKAGSNYIVKAPTWNAPWTEKIENVLIPAGVALTINSGSATNKVHVWYEVL